MILRPFLLSVLFFAVAFFALEVVEPDLTPTAYLARADALLTGGAFADALLFYDAAVKADPQNYLSVFKRGATYLSIGRLQPALADFDLALEMKPDFDSALVQRGRLRTKLGLFDDALKDFKKVSHPSQAKNIENVKISEKALAAATKAYQKGDADECIEQTSAAIAYASSLMVLRSMRAECRLKKGLVLEAISDISHLASSNPLANEPHARIARLQFFYLNERDRAVQQLAKCLHFDPDAKQCKALFRSYKKLDKELVKAFQFKEKRMWGTFEKAAGLGTANKEALLPQVKRMMQEIDEEESIAKDAPRELFVELLEGMCETSLELSHWNSDYCDQLLDFRPNAVMALLFTAKKHLNEGELERAINILTNARDSTGGQNQRINNMLHEAQVLLKQANSKNYYKVLGVSRTADEKEIRKAYRNKTKEFHPDKYRGDLKPDQVEKKMAEINEAYEVLSTPDLRDRFDNGDDPNDHSPPGGPRPGQNQFFHQQHFGGQYFGGFGGGPGPGGGQRQFFQQSGGQRGRTTNKKGFFNH
ncbi:uncharacterized protein V2V93DRAFT_368537 [Kockiozyma suomiensis]|uniref:uncharacterized protein n=1 Tax=Kockiozyma suomiensis TaxID=1337062 RepID=UPI003343DA4B